MRTITCVMIAGFLFLLGCENKELIQCQQDLGSTQGQLAKAEQGLQQVKGAYDEMVRQMAAEKQKAVEAQQKQIEQARLEERKKCDTKLKEMYAKRDELTRSILELQGTVKRLGTQSNGLAVQLAQAEMKAKEREAKFKNTGEMLQAMAAKNKQLEAENKRLKAMVDQLQKQLEGEGEGKDDSGNIE
jgi:chromosome segregation ATPase